MGAGHNLSQDGTLASFPERLIRAAQRCHNAFKNMLSFSVITLSLTSTPVVSVRGVFMPGWIFYALGAVLITVIIREIVIRLNGGPVDGLGAPFYTALSVVLGLGAYLLRIGGL